MERILQPEILGVMIPILAIVVGGAVFLSRAWITHRERMAMIAIGLHPDYPPHEEARALKEGELEEFPEEAETREFIRKP